MSHGDKSRDKFDFYARVNTREVLMIDRDPWQLELYRLDANGLKFAGSVASSDTSPLMQSTVGLQFHLLTLLTNRKRPQSSS